MSADDQIEELKRIIAEEREATRQRRKANWVSKSEEEQEAIRERRRAGAKVYHKTRQVSMPEEERRRVLAYRRKAEAKYREKVKANPELKKRIYATLVKYRARPDIKKKLTDISMKYVRQKRVRLAGRPKPEMCDVCGRGGRIVFDHCHNSNKFRGWICHNCNVILGLADDNITFLEKLIIYLRTAENAEDE